MTKSRRLSARLRLPLQVRQRIEDQPGARDALALLRELRRPTVPLTLTERDLMIAALEQWTRDDGQYSALVTAKPRRHLKHRVGEKSAKPFIPTRTAMPVVKAGRQSVRTVSGGLPTLGRR